MNDTAVTMAIAMTATTASLNRVKASGRSTMTAVVKPAATIESGGWSTGEQFGQRLLIARYSAFSLCGW